MESSTGPVKPWQSVAKPQHAAAKRHGSAHVHVVEPDQEHPTADQVAFQFP